VPSGGDDGDDAFGPRRATGRNYRDTRGHLRSGVGGFFERTTEPGHKLGMRAPSASSLVHRVPNLDRHARSVYETSLHAEQFERTLNLQSHCQDPRYHFPPSAQPRLSSRSTFSPGPTLKPLRTDERVSSSSSKTHRSSSQVKSGVSRELMSVGPATAVSASRELPRDDHGSAGGIGKHSHIGELSNEDHGFLPEHLRSLHHGRLPTGNHSEHQSNLHSELYKPHLRHQQYQPQNQLYYQEHQQQHLERVARNMPCFESDPEDRLISKRLRTDAAEPE